jgi:hypothetical protein
MDSESPLVTQIVDAYREGILARLHAFLLTALNEQDEATKAQLWSWANQASGEVKALNLAIDLLQAKTGV